MRDISLSDGCKGKNSRISAQREADRNGEIELLLSHTRRERGHRLRALDQRQHLGIEIGKAGALDDAPRQHVAAAVDAEGQHDYALFVALPRTARIVLELLQVFEQERLPGRVDAWSARFGAYHGTRGRTGLFHLLWWFLFRNDGVGRGFLRRRGLVDLRLLLLVDFRRGQFDRNDRRIVAEFRVCCLPPQQVAGDDRGVDARNDSGGDGPAREIAGIVLLEPRQRAYR